MTPQPAEAKVSRQVKWQQKQREAGNCIQCGRRREEDLKRKCLACMVQERDRKRAKDGTKKSYNSLTRRIEGHQ